MLEIRFDRFGAPPAVAKCVQASALPSPSAWEVIVKIEAFPINPADLAMLSGRYGYNPTPPSTIGMEAVGKVVDRGSSVTDIAIGDRVMVVANNNWAQLRAVPANLVHVVPQELDPLTAAVMKVNPATALMLLTKFVDLKPGSWVVQNAPLSNVGRLVIRFAKAFGLRTINLLRREEAKDLVKQLGGDVALLDSETVAKDLQQAVGRVPIRLGLDAVAGGSTGNLARCCNEGATVITYGMLSGEPCQIAAEEIVFRQVKHQGYWLSKILNRFTKDDRVALYDRLTELLIASDFKPHFDACFTIEQIREALEFASSGAGKAIVFPNGVPTDSALARSLVTASH